MMHKTLSFIFLLAFCFSFVKLRSQTVEDYEKLDSVIQAHIESKPALVAEDAKNLVAMAIRIGNDSLIFRAYMAQGEIFNKLGMFDQSQKILYDLLPDLEKSKKYSFLKELYFNLGLMNFQMEDHAKALEFQIKSKKAAILAGRLADTVRINSEIALELVGVGKTEEGIRLGKQTLELAKRIDNEADLIYVVDNLSNSYAHLNEFEKALDLQKELLDYKSVIENPGNLLGVYQHMGEILIGLNRFEQAQPYVTQATRLAKEMDSNEWLYECYKNQSAIYEAQGKWKDALRYHKLYLNVKDSVYRSDYAYKMSTMAGYYQLNEKREAIRELEFDKLKANEKIRTLYLWIFALVSGMIALLLFINHRKNKRDRELRQQFSAQQLKSIEEERQNIAKMLHDSIGQNILFIKNYIHKHGLNTAQLDQSIDHSLEEVRNISKDLYPNQLQHYGLGPAVETLCDKVRESTHVFVSSDIQLPKEHLVSQDIKINLYRIIQECISNSLKHAAATSIRITGEIIHGKFHLMVQDNGKGFDPQDVAKRAAATFGLLNIEERARILRGSFKIESLPGQGTKNTVIVPLF